MIKKRCCSFFIAVFFVLISFGQTKLFPDIELRTNKATISARFFESENLLSPIESFSSRLEFATEFSAVLNDFLEHRVHLSAETYSHAEVLIEEFRDELKLLKLKNDINELSFNRKRMSDNISGRLALISRGTLSHPSDLDSITALPYVYLNYTPRDSNIALRLGIRSTSSRPGFMKIDEASCSWVFGKRGRIRFGRIYFILGHLGLIGDNNFDAFEGAVLEMFPFGTLGLNLIYARLSSTNYPYTGIFQDYDDYLATRISKELFKKNLEIGLNTLFSGIASEDALSLDLYWRYSKNRDFIAELAFYRPSKTTIVEGVDPYEAKYAFVAGADVINTKRANIFLQIGDVQRGFAPMATSLAYSAQNHLYFDQDTRGFDITFSYYPAKKIDTEMWQTRPERTGLVPQETIYEINIVGLWDGEWRKSANRYVFRHIRSLGRDIRLYIENNLWDREPSISWQYRGVYNETRLSVSYEL